MNQFESFISCLDALKSQSLQLYEQNEKINDHLTNKKFSLDDSFLIYSTDFDEDIVKIINNNFMEFSEIAYDHHYLLTTRKEINRNVGVYLTSFEDDCDLDDTLRVIDELINRKQSVAPDDNLWPMKRVMPYLRQIGNGMEVLKSEMIVLSENRIKVKMDGECEGMKQDIRELKFKVSAIETKIHDDIHEIELKRFYDQANLELVRKSTEILDKICEKLSVGGSKWCEPPFKHIESIEDKRKELIVYFNLLQKNKTKGTDMQIKIRKWIELNRTLFVYIPTIEEVEKWKLDFKRNFGLKNTIGQLVMVNYTFYDRKFYWGLAVANRKIVCWTTDISEENAFQSVYNNLKSFKWSKDAKFVTRLVVSDKLSDYFILVDSEEHRKICDNIDIINWLRRNFHSQNCFNEEYYRTIPAIYTLCLQSFEVQ